jgi:hypothetical protein
MMTRILGFFSSAAATEADSAVVARTVIAAPKNFTFRNELIISSTVAKTSRQFLPRLLPPKASGLAAERKGQAMLHGPPLGTIALCFQSSAHG